MMTKPRGYTIWTGPSKWDYEDIMVIATLQTANKKTGDMPQVWIMRQDMAPQDAAKYGEDASVCGDCKVRPLFAKQNRVKECYVTLGQAPRAVYDAYHRGLYPDIPRGFKFDRPVRIGAYGDPAMVPMPVWRKFLKRCDYGWTAYTHQWGRSGNRHLKSFCMASVDSEPEQALAVGDGWRTFRSIQKNDDINRPLVSKFYGFTSDGRRQEIYCPASPEGHHRSTCAECRLCDGRYYGKDDRRKNIAIHAH
jgi:hypothetical protein